MSSQCRFTWATDLVRLHGPLDRTGFTMSRDEAHTIIVLLATIIQHDKESLLDKLADYHKQHEIQLQEEMRKRYERTKQNSGA